MLFFLARGQESMSEGDLRSLIETLLREVGAEGEASWEEWEDAPWRRRRSRPVETERRGRWLEEYISGMVRGGGRAFDIAI